jgi:hypothetical protein
MSLLVAHWLAMPAAATAESVHALSPRTDAEKKIVFFVVAGPNTDLTEKDAA